MLISRIRARHDEPDTFERVDYLKEVRELFLSFCNGDVVRVDASLGEAAVREEVWRQVAAALTARGLL